MDWQERMNAALDYIEEHLEENVDWMRAAAGANCSTRHFLRMFEALAGMGPGEYVRRRRLSRAALELSRGGVKVIDLALRLGYETPDAFGRAFKRELGLTPSEARRPGAVLKTWPRFSFSVVLKGDTPMDFKIEHKEAFTVTGLPLATTSAGKKAYTKIPAFWKKCGENKNIERLWRAMPEGSPLGLMGVSADDWDPETGNFTYLIAIESPADRSKLPPGCVDVKAPASAWAIFTARGPLPKAFQEMNDRIWSEWFPDSGYERSSGPNLEIYPEGDSCAADYRCELWIPVKKAKKK
ncbi:MAG: AraC family transcriptional regulator [Spirochaetales bacterium]|nr:AraC family transcriptional regulator [Spirochaetales bacterium]